MEKPKNGFQFVFKPEELQKLLDEKPKKIIVSCYLVEETTQDGRKVGAMHAWADGVGKSDKGAKASGVPNGVPGCPIPPCIEN